MEDAPRFTYTGEAALRPAIEEALHRVVDPEMAIDIVELGLVYKVELSPGRADVDITMTSAACPVSEMIVGDIEHELHELLGADTVVDVRLVWDPPWSPEYMSERAREAFGW